MRKRKCALNKKNRHTVNNGKVIQWLSQAWKGCIEMCYVYINGIAWTGKNFN